MTTLDNNRPDKYRYCKWHFVEIYEFEFELENDEEEDWDDDSDL